MNVTDYGKVLGKVSAHSVGPVVIQADSEVDTFTNKGAGAAVTFNLPPAKAGMTYLFLAEAVQNIVIDPNGTETISLAGTPQGAGVAITGTGALNLALLITCVTDGVWKDVVQRGTWA